MEPEISPAIVLSGVGCPPRPKPAIWLVLLVPVMPTLLRPKPRPSPRLGVGTGVDCDWELEADEMGVVGVGREGADEAVRRGLLGGLGVLFVWGEGLD